MRRVPSCVLPMMALLLSGAQGCGDPQLTQRAPGGGKDASSPTIDVGFFVAARDGETELMAPPQCAEQAVAARRLLDTYLLVDTTASMAAIAESTTSSKLKLVRNAIIDFLKDPKSADLGVGLNFFPIQPPECETDSDCMSYELQWCKPAPGDRHWCAVEGCKVGEFTRRIVAIGDLSKNLAPLEATLGAKGAYGGNNDATALEGTFGYLQTHAAANPNRRVVLVYVSDGLPVNDACKSNSLDAAVAA